GLLAAAMEPNRTPPLVVALDDSDDPADAIDAMALGRFIAGAEPFACSQYLSRVRSEARLLPPGVEAAWSAKGDGRRAMLARGEGWTLRAVRWASATATVTVTAASDELARDVLARAVAGAVEPAPPEDVAAPVGFWHQ